MKIGFIGLGIMGSRMAANLQKHGYPLVVFNRTHAKAEPLLGSCGTFSDSPAKVAEQVDILLTMLAHPDAVEQAALGRDGFLGNLKPSALWVDCSSVNPSFSKKMAAAAARREVHLSMRLSPAPRQWRRTPNLFSGSAQIRPTWKRFARCYCAWGTKLFTPADTGWVLL
jgi:hypothetical protein